MAAQNSSKIHEAVRSRYGEIARTFNPRDVPQDADLTLTAASCCEPASETNADCGCKSELYDAALLEELPFDVTGLSLGCGDPVTLASLQPEETVLDLGSGGGIDCFLAAKQVGERGYVIGVDMTPEMLAKANANKAKLHYSNVEFRQGQIEALPVDDNTIDVVMSNCVINLSPNKPEVFSEVFRVLKPGGRISISDIVTEGAFTEAMRADAAAWSECISGAIDMNEYTGLLRAAGFVNVKVVDKVDAKIGVSRREDVPRIFSARITAQKPVQAV